MWKIVLPIIAILVIGTSLAFAEEDPDEVNVFWTFFEDRKVKTTNETWYVEIAVAEGEKVIIKQFGSETPEEFFLRISDILRILTPAPVVEPTEGEKAHEEVMKIIEEKIAEISEERKKLDELKIMCKYGQDGFKVIQKNIDFESLERLIQNVGSKEYAKMTLNKAYETCRAMTNYKVDLRQWEDYPAVDERKEIFLSTLSVYDTLNRADSEIWNKRTLTPHDLIEAVKDAEERQCSVKGKQQGLCVKEFSGVNPGGYTFDKVCQFNPITQRVDLCPKQALADYHEQEIKTFGTAMTILCEQAYKKTWHGTTSKNWWPDLLIDGTCDTLIDELVETRGDYVREDWKGQTKDNCPDCQRFKE